MNIETFYNIFRNISKAVNSSGSLREVLDLVVLKASEVLEAEGASLRLHNEEKAEFQLAATCGLGERLSVLGPVPSEDLLAEQVFPNKVIIIVDIFNSPRVRRPQEAWDAGVRMILDVPLTIKNWVLGMLRIYLVKPREFSEGELDFLLSVAELSACAINKARTFELQQELCNYLALKTTKLSALGRLAAGIAHEINNPLASVLLYASNIVKKTPEEGPVRKGLEVIIRETKRCKEIIQGLLEFSRDSKPQMTEAGLNQVIEKALAIVENEFRLQHIRVETQLADNIEPILMDENQMEQVFINLFINSIQAIGHDGLITVSTWLEPDQGLIKIVVRDNGCGVPPEDMPRVFEPFFSTKAKGVGLGLAVSYGIIQNHHGEIALDSKPGEGTCVTISLPA
ncbi:MAG: ATP-binding protein [Thermodesulfobacteriota bacterium]